jgi:hypothetical protein
MIGDAGKDIGKPGLRIDVVHLGRDDKTADGSRPLTTPIGTGKEPRPSSESNSAQRPLGRIIRQAVSHCTCKNAAVQA